MIAEFLSNGKSRFSVAQDSGPTTEFNMGSVKNAIKQVNAKSGTLQRTAVLAIVSDTERGQLPGPVAPPVPPVLPVSEGISAKVLYSYEATQDGLLSITEGEKIQILEQDSDWWLACDKHGDEGWIPAAYVQLL